MSLQNCPICLETLAEVTSKIEVYSVASTFKESRSQDFKEAIQMTCCHVYHADCISRWWRISRHCPECRGSMRRWTRVVWRETHWIQTSDSMYMPPINFDISNRSPGQGDIRVSVNEHITETNSSSNSHGATIIANVGILLLIILVLYFVSKGLC